MNYNAWGANTDTSQGQGVTLPEVGVSGSVSTSATGVSASAQITGVIVILLVIAVVFMVNKWPLLS